jgi:hypothetical protein
LLMIPLRGLLERFFTSQEISQVGFKTFLNEVYKQTLKKLCSCITEGINDSFVSLTIKTKRKDMVHLTKVIFQYHVGNLNWMMRSKTISYKSKDLKSLLKNFTPSRSISKYNQTV